MGAVVVTPGTSYSRCSSAASGELPRAHRGNRATRPEGAGTLRCNDAGHASGCAMRVHSVSRYSRPSTNGAATRHTRHPTNAKPERPTVRKGLGLVTPEKLAARIDSHGVPGSQLRTSTPVHRSSARRRARQGAGTSPSRLRPSRVRRRRRRFGQLHAAVSRPAQPELDGRASSGHAPCAAPSDHATGRTATRSRITRRHSAGVCTPTSRACA